MLCIKEYNVVCNKDFDDLNISLYFNTIDLCNGVIDLISIYWFNSISFDNNFSWLIISIGNELLFISLFI